MENEFAIASLTTGKLNALVKNIMRQTGVNDPIEAVRLVNSGKWTLSEVSSWHEEDGIIYFTVTSKGTTGPQWVKLFKEKGFSLADWVKDYLLSGNFESTNGVTTVVAVFKRKLLGFEKLSFKDIYSGAGRLNWNKPTIEIGCLIRLLLTGNDIVKMGLDSIITMHNPVSSPSGNMKFLFTSKNFWGSKSLTTFCEEDDPSLIKHNYGFAFISAQTNIPV
jgi:hypothetical protein